MKLPKGHAWQHVKECELMRKLQYCTFLPEQIRDNYWLLKIIVDYSREDWGYFPLNKKVDDLSKEGCNVAPKDVCGIVQLNSDEKFWREEIKYGYEILEWTQLSQSSTRKYYVNGHCHSDSENFLTQGKVVHVTQEVVAGGVSHKNWETIFLVPDYKRPSVLSGGKNSMTKKKQG